MALMRRNQTLSAIPSMESETYNPDIPQIFPSLSNLRIKSLSVDSASDTSEFPIKPCALTQSYFNTNLDKNLLSRTHSLVADDQVIDIEYDSDIGWQTKNVRRNPYQKSFDTPSENFAPRVGRDRSYSRYNLKLNLRNEKCSSTQRTLPEPLSKSQRRQLHETRYNEALSRKMSINSNSNESDAKANSKTDKHKQKSTISKSVKEQFEGKVVQRQMTDDKIKGKYICEKAIGFDNEFANAERRASTAADKRNVFAKCKSRSSATSNDSIEAKSGDDEIVDEVFDSPSGKGETQPPRGKSTAVKHNPNRRSSSLEALPSKNRNKSSESKSRISSVSIVDKPKYIEHSSPSDATKSGKIASSHAIAKLHTKLSRGSLKKPSTTPSNSDYDRDRGRSRHLEGGHRESFKKNERTNERGSDQDRDASDRELKDGSLNRSLSNTDTNLEDRIGE